MSDFPHSPFWLDMQVRTVNAINANKTNTTDTMITFVSKDTFCDAFQTLSPHLTSVFLITLIKNGMKWKPSFCKAKQLFWTPRMNLG